MTRTQRLSDVRRRGQQMRRSGRTMHWSRTEKSRENVSEGAVTAFSSPDSTAAAESLARLCWIRECEDERASVNAADLAAPDSTAGQTSQLPYYSPPVLQLQLQQHAYESARGGRCLQRTTTTQRGGSSRRTIDRSPSSLRPRVSMTSSSSTTSMHVNTRVHVSRRSRRSSSPHSCRL